ncbi:hypothetical protein ACLBOM_20105 [Escherichia coli]
MKDNDHYLGALIVGVRSFKIEGRYKDMSYVKISPPIIARCLMPLL